VRPGGDQAYLNAGLQAAVATLLALRARWRDGAGQIVDVSALRALPITSHTAMAELDFAGRVLTRQGTRHPSAADGLYRCADGWVVLASGSWDALAAWVEEEAPTGLDLTHPRWRDARTRVAEAAAVDVALDRWLRQRTRDALYEEALRRRVMLAPVRTPAELFADPQLRARGFFQRVAGVEAQLPGAPYRLGATPWRLGGPAPALGEANAQVYVGALGLSRADRARLRAAGVI
jgi:benzylsuccinate CoA-transferase BbsE subunit